MANSPRQYANQQRADSGGPGESGAATNTGGNGNGNGNGHGRGGPKAACNRCRGQKLRCIWDDGSGRCRRCTRADSACTVPPRRPMGRPPTQAHGQSRGQLHQDLDPPPLRDSRQQSINSIASILSVSDSSSAPDRTTEDSAHSPMATTSSTTAPSSMSDASLLGFATGAGGPNLTLSTSLFPPEVVPWSLGSATLPTPTSTTSTSNFRPGFTPPPSLTSLFSFSDNWELPNGWVQASLESLLAALDGADDPFSVQNSFGLYNSANGLSANDWANPRNSIATPPVERSDSAQGTSSGDASTPANATPDNRSSQDDWANVQMEMDVDSNSGNSSNNNHIMRPNHNQTRIHTRTHVSPRQSTSNVNNNSGARATSRATSKEEINFTKQLCDLHIAVLLHPLHNSAILNRKYRLGPSLAGLALGRLFALTAQVKSMMMKMPTVLKESVAPFDGTATPDGSGGMQQQQRRHQVRTTSVANDRATALLALSIYTRLEVAYSNACRILQDAVENTTNTNPNNNPNNSATTTITSNGDILADDGADDGNYDEDLSSYTLMPELAIDGFSLGACHDFQLRFVLQLCEQLLDRMRQTIAGIGGPALGGISPAADGGAAGVGGIRGVGVR
ncbi:hypothetical protein B0I37DRAFT_442422 [Chaetomium sp. MPI-CAGE-AT-0009]|nr:hypothetical protein B0I37DRAFT_442422 [Chaetomium sp. MPI-CAGE-AT-0009]